MNERHHAHLILCFYSALHRRPDADGRAVFRSAVKTYAEERGRRMAIRAERHGLKKNFIAYLSHSEWTASDPGFFDIQQELQEPGCIVTRVYRCPWNTVFKENGGEKCGPLYCSLIDTHIVKGFNPKLRLEVATLLYSAECCTFFWRDGDIDEGSVARIAELKDKYRKENSRPFDYHIGHLFARFRTEIMKHYGTQGDALMDEVTACFKEKFSNTEFQTILNYQKEMQKAP
jgi:hypothetical protein